MYDPASDFESYDHWLHVALCSHCLFIASLRDLATLNKSKLFRRNRASRILQVLVPMKELTGSRHAFSTALELN